MNLKPNELLGVEQIPIGTLQTYSCNDLYQMLDRAQKELEQAKRRKEWIESTINLKYQEQLYSRRLEADKDSGIVHVFDDEYKISSNVVKKVEWDQKILAKLAQDLESKRLQVSDFIDISYNVPENRYSRWSKAQQSRFNSARTIKLSRPYIKLQKIIDNDGGSSDE